MTVFHGNLEEVRALREQNTLMKELLRDIVAGISWQVDGFAWIAVDSHVIERIEEIAHEAT